MSNGKRCWNLWGCVLSAYRSSGWTPNRLGRWQRYVRPCFSLTPQPPLPYRERGSQPIPRLPAPLPRLSPPLPLWERGPGGEGITMRVWQAHDKAITALAALFFPHPPAPSPIKGEGETAEGDTADPTTSSP